MLGPRCVVILAAAATAAVAAVKQFRSDYEYSANAEGWFKFHKTPTEWSLADLQCYYEGATLASPLNIDIKYKMASIIKEHNNLTGLGVHTGINNRHNNAQYTSVEGVPLSELSVQYTGLFPDEYGSTAYCMRMFAQGDLLAGNCNDALPYICYKKFDGEQKLTECGTIDKDYQYDRRTGNCYKFHKYATNWTLAYMTCAAEGGHLAIINSAEEANVLKELYAKYPDKTIRGAEYPQITFIGFLDWYKKGTWRTIQGESLENAGYANWGNGQPDNMLYKGQYQRCGGMFRSGQLDDLACELEYSFICEKNPKTLRP